MNNTDQDKESLRRYWKAAISALPTTEQQNAAWEFYLEKFSGSPRAGDTLSGLVLLLEANGAFLLTLPEKFHEELTGPITEELGALREELHSNAERERASLRALEAANKNLEKANQHLENIMVELSGKMSAAVGQIDVFLLAVRVQDQLLSSIVSPLKTALNDLPRQSLRIAEATQAAESSVEDMAEGTSRRNHPQYMRCHLFDLLPAFHCCLDLAPSPVKARLMKRFAMSERIRVGGPPGFTSFPTSPLSITVAFTG